MSGAGGAESSQYGFVGVRGRGYRPEQVEAAAATLSGERDEAWERAAHLTVLVKEMEEEAERLREAVANLAPQTYESLGKRAQYLLELAEEEDTAVRGAALADAQAEADAARAAADEARDDAQAHSDEVRGKADEYAQRRLAAGQAESDDIRVAARRDVKETRGEALAVLREMRERTDADLAAQAKEHAERTEGADREAAEQVAASEAWEAGAVAEAEERLSEAKRMLGETEEEARHSQEDAEAAAAELLARARARAERVERETESILEGHESEREELRAHMEHVRASLATLTGKSPAETE
ncbi:cellulose-binding protein [Streptomyces sp. NPDC002790]|uniref:cellulose-binding protein n=1 Tax=Streptomyces sp. NPDC002790 TaxID=3154431 RepID=UPI003317B558